MAAGVRSAPAATILTTFPAALFLPMPTETVPPSPDVEAVAEETSARKVNTMLRAGWRLLAVIHAHDGCGGYPVYVAVRPRTVNHQAITS